MWEKGSAKITPGLCPWVPVARTVRKGQHAASCASNSHGIPILVQIGFGAESFWGTAVLTQSWRAEQIEVSMLSPDSLKVRIRIPVACCSDVPGL